MTDLNRDDALEGDYEILAVDPGHRVGGIVSVRLNPDEMDVLIALSQAAGRTMSETLRVALRTLADEPAKASHATSARPATRGGTARVSLTTNESTWGPANT